jgi:hypothetical protein
LPEPLAWLALPELFDPRLEQAGLHRCWPELGPEPLGLQARHHPLPGLWFLPALVLAVAALHPPRLRPVLEPSVLPMEHRQPPGLWWHPALAPPVAVPHLPDLQPAPRLPVVAAWRQPAPGPSQAAARPNLHSAQEPPQRKRPQSPAAAPTIRAQQGKPQIHF